MSKRTGRKPKRERTSRRRTRRHSSTSETSSEDVPPPQTTTKTRASSRVNESEKKVALTIKLPKTEGNDCNEENTTGMWKVECSNGSDGDIQKLKISLRRSPKDLLREQAAEEKRKEKEEVAGSSTHSTALDVSVANYLEQFGSTMAEEETEQTIVDSYVQVQDVIPINEPPCIQDNAVKVDNDQIDNEALTEFTIPQESIVENISTNDNMLIDEIVSESIIKTNETHVPINDHTEIAVSSIKTFNSLEDIPETMVHPFVMENTAPETISTNTLINVSKVESSNVIEIVTSNVEIPIALSEKIQDIKPESVQNVVDSNTYITIKEENSSTDEVTTKEENTLTDEVTTKEEKTLTDEVTTKADNTLTDEIRKTDNSTIEELNKIDVINDSEQMEDVVQLTVESPDLVDDEDTKPVFEEESNSVIEDKFAKQVDENKSKLVDYEETKSVEDVGPMLSDICYSKQTDVEKEFKPDDMPKSVSFHTKRKWGSCKTRTSFTIVPFTLGTIIDSNSDYIGGNGEYRSEEGEIQRTDSDEEPYADEAMEMNDTMLIDHEAVDYEAPEEEEKPDNNESKSDRSMTEEINEEELSVKKSSVKRTITTNVIRITNLVRPFTVGQLRDLLQRTGKIVSNGFWIDTIKSQCIVEYENEDQAIETVYALNESQWPSTNPKFLRVVFTDKEELNKALNGTHPDKLSKQKELPKVEKLRTQLDNHIILREWDRGKLEDMNGEKEGDKPIKRKIPDNIHVQKDKKMKKDEKNLDRRKKSKSKTPERIPTKSLDELFRKTKTTPTLYWSPLSIEQITEKEDQRRKHLAEMERSQKPDRRRRDINLYPRRR